jgi:hypothetical protein
VNEARSKVYLAGPEVFLPRARALQVAEEKGATCASLGLEGDDKKFLIAALETCWACTGRCAPSHWLELLACSPAPQSCTA